MALRFFVLGPPEIRIDTGATLVPEPRQGALLAALAINANAPVSPDRLAEAAWEDPSPSTVCQVRAAVSDLHRGVCSLAGATQEARIHWRRGGYLLAVDEDELDLDRFTMLFRQGRAALDADDNYAAAHLLGEALTVWRGPAGAGGPAYGWLRQRLADIDELRLCAAEGRLMALLALGQTGSAIAEARALLADDPLREPWWACLIAGLRDSGELSVAQQAHDEARRTFVARFGMVPDHARRLLHTALLPSQLRGTQWLAPATVARPAVEPEL